MLTNDSAPGPCGRGALRASRTDQLRSARATGSFIAALLFIEEPLLAVKPRFMVESPLAVEPLFMVESPLAVEPLVMVEPPLIGGVPLFVVAPLFMDEPLPLVPLPMVGTGMTRLLLPPRSLDVPVVPCALGSDRELDGALLVLFSANTRPTEPTTASAANVEVMKFDVFMEDPLNMLPGDSA